MPSPTKPTTRERLIEAARELFNQQGFNATGLAQILGQAEVRSGSLYHFFRSKEDLLLAVLQRYQELLDPVVLAPIRERYADPLERVFGLLERYRSMLLATRFKNGCPIGKLALELDEFHPDAVHLVAENFSGWREAVEGWLEEAAERLPARPGPATLATFVLTVMEGAVMQSRSHGSITPFDQSVESLRDYFDRLILDPHSRQGEPS